MSHSQRPPINPPAQVETGVVVLTERGKDLLESYGKQHTGSRDRGGRGGGKEDDSRQRFSAELKKPREVEHDSQSTARTNVPPNASSSGLQLERLCRGNGVSVRVKAPCVGQFLNTA